MPYTVHEDAVALDQNMEYVELPAEEQLQTTSKNWNNNDGLHLTNKMGRFTNTTFTRRI
jgi:hypothetical protein